MPEQPPKLRWDILSDTEVASGANDAFGVHTAYARLLQQIATKCPTPFSIGLYSSWGTGKTSIIRLLQEIIAKDPTQALSLIYLDVWKYSADPLKRWVLLETERQLADQKLLQEYSFQNRSLQSHLEFEEELEEKDKLEIDFKNFGLILGVLLAVLILSGIAWAYVPESWRIRDALRFVLTLSAGGSLIAIILAAALKKVGESMSGLLFRRTIKHTTAKPAFSSEKFAQIFRDIVAKVTQDKDKRRLVFAFDNLDRCQAEVGVEVIGVIKTFLDEPGCIYVVPCDEEAILTHIKSSFLKSSNPEVSVSYANQFLTKLFQMTLRLPPAADFAVEEYLDRELKEAKMEDLTTDARDVLVLGYRGETPRQIKRVLNDLMGYRAIAEQIEADGLVERGALTSDLGHLTKMAVLSVKWPSFMRRLAEDPILWTDAMQRVRNQMDVGMEDIPHDLQQFLWNTRFVSPDVDIRPWLYFRRGTLEKDASLNRRIEEVLQNGAWKQFLDLLADASLQDKKKDILQIAASKVRRWKMSNRRVLLINACPVMLKASLAAPEDAELRRVTLDAIDYLTTEASADQLERQFDIKDILSIARTAQAWLRKKLLTKYTELFGTRYPTTENRAEVWKQIIQQGDLLDTTDRNSISADIAGRYTMQPNGEGDVLSLLSFASEDLQARSWSIKPVLLEVIAGAITFDGSDPDKKRLTVFVSLRNLITKTAVKIFLGKVALSIDPARTSQADAQAQSALSTLFKINSDLLRESDVGPITSALLSQANRSAVATKTWWLLGLLHLYPLLKEQELGSLDALFKATFLDADPAETINLFKAIHKSWLKSLLGMNRFTAVLKAQPQNYQRRFAANAVATREQQISAFDPIEVLKHPEMFDESLAWDLAIFVRTIQRALEAKSIGISDATRHLEEFCAKHLASAGPAPNDLYTQVIQFLERFPEIASVPLAEIIVKREIAAILAEDYSGYTRFRHFKALLQPSRRLELDKELLQPLSTRKGRWEQLLVQLADDVSSDADVSKNPAVATDLADYAFSGAREKWAETAGCLASIVPLLERSRQYDYVDRSLQALLGLEADGDEIAKMDPFLRLIQNQAQHLDDGALGSMAAKFIQRMLGAARPNPEKLKILQFTLSLSRPVLLVIRPSIEQLLESTDAQISADAQAVLQKLDS